MLADVRLALRSFRQQPGFTALAIVIIGLGAGANTSIFSIVRAVLLEPLPYHEPARLVSIAPSRFVSNADLAFLRSRAHSFELVAVSSPGWTMSLVGAGDPQRVTAAKTSANLFEVLGVTAHLGRTFVAGEDEPGRHRVVVLSHALWTSKFSGDRAAIGRVITLEDAPHEIIGVMGPEFELLGRDAELWMPLPFDPRSPFWKGTVSQAIARLRHGTDVAAATRELRSLVPDWRREVGYEEDWGADMRAAKLRDLIVGDVRPTLIVLGGAVLLVLVLTAANLGTLQLGRQVARRRELAVRTALGASSWRLARQAATEGVVIATAGALAGSATAWLALPALLRVLPPEMPRLAVIRIDGLLLAGVFGATALAVLGCSVAPALTGARPDLQRLLRLGAQSETRAARRTLDTLVISQIALGVVLGMAAALLGRSLIALQQVDPGFDPSKVLTLKLQPSRGRAPDVTAAAAYYTDMIDRIRTLPGVVDAGGINHLPLSGYNWATTIKLDDRPLPPGVTPPTAGWRMIHGGYFEAMRIPLLAGRLFSAHDTRQTPRVAIVNDTFARTFFGGTSAAVGRTIRAGSASMEELVTVVGVVGSVRHVSLAREPGPEMYRPVSQSFPIAMALVVRTTTTPGAIASAVRQAVRSVDRSVPIADMAPLTTLLRESLGRPRLLALLLLVFAGIGIAILLTGVYGVTAYTTKRRERELGIRLALGASPASVALLVVRQGVAYAAAGLAVGVPVTLAAGTMLRGLLFGINARDPATFAGLCGIVVAATIGATLGPARRALGVNPAASLRID